MSTHRAHWGRTFLHSQQAHYWIEITEPGLEVLGTRWKTACRQEILSFVEPSTQGSGQRCAGCEQATSSPSTEGTTNSRH